MIEKENKSFPVKQSEIMRLPLTMRCTDNFSCSLKAQLGISLLRKSCEVLVAANFL